MQSYGKRPNLDLGVGGWVQQSLLRKPYIGQDLKDWSSACLWNSALGKGRPSGGTRLYNLDEPIKGYCAKLQGRVQGEGGVGRQGYASFSWYLPLFGFVIGNDALARIISLMERSNDPIIGSALDLQEK